MTHKIKVSAKFLTVDGERTGVWFSAGGWVDGVDPTTIKIRPKKGWFAGEARKAFAVTNNSDMREDYFEIDSIVVTSSHPFYGQVKAAARAAGEPI